MQHPVADARVLDVHELGANRVRIDSLQRCDHLTQRHRSIVQEEFRGDAKIEILVAKAKLAQTEQRIFGAFVGQRIHPGNGVSQRPIRVNQPVDSCLQRTFSNIGAQGGWRSHRPVLLRQVA